MNQPVVLEAGALRIGFEYAGDRWGHWIESIDREATRVRSAALQCRAARQGTEAPDDECAMAGPARMPLASLEGQANEAWPPSPALQSLHIEKRAGGVVVALLVGMAGSNHWSLSVEVHPQSERALFDAACRTRAERAWLGSTYSFAPGLVIAENGLLDADGRRLRVTPDSPAVPTVLSFSDRQLCLAPDRTAHAGKEPRTVRWRYVIECA